MNSQVVLQKKTLISKYSIFNQYIKNKYLILMLLPGLFFYIVFKYAPIYGLLIAFKDYKLLAGIMGSPWVGFDNFKDVFMIRSFWNSFRNTLIISSFQLIFGFPAPIILALLLNEIRHLKFKKTVQTISYLPHFASWAILGGLLVQFLSPNTGPINILLKSMDLSPVYFLGDTRWFRSTLVFTQVWKNMGWNSIIYLAALSGIDQEMYEAADMDGVTRLQKMFHITLPSLAPVVTIMLIFAVGQIINDNFEQVFVLYNAAVYSVGDVISTYAYRMGLQNLKYSFSTAIGLFTNIISFILVIVANYIAKKINEYGIW